MTDTDQITLITSTKTKDSEQNNLFRAWFHDNAVDYTEISHKDFTGVVSDYAKNIGRFPIVFYRGMLLRNYNPECLQVIAQQYQEDIETDVSHD